MAREFAVEVEWVPFELHPETPAEGYERPEQSTVARQGMRDHIYRLAEAAGLPLQSNKVVANAHKSLEAGEWARDQGRETFERVHRALFHAYFAEARNISTTAQVLDALRDADLALDGLQAALESGTYAPRVDELTSMARQNGISATPTFIFEDAFVVSGAQDFELFADLLTRMGVPRRAGVEPADGPADAGADDTLIDPGEIR